MAHTVTPLEIKTYIRVYTSEGSGRGLLAVNGVDIGCRMLALGGGRVFDLVRFSYFFQ